MGRRIESGGVFVGRCLAVLEGGGRAMTRRGVWFWWRRLGLGWGCRRRVGGRGL